MLFYVLFKCRFRDVLLATFLCDFRNLSDITITNSSINIECF
jgi:hypothetical protein